MGMMIRVFLSLLCMCWWPQKRRGWQRFGILQGRRGVGIHGFLGCLMIRRWRWWKDSFSPYKGREWLRIWRIGCGGKRLRMGTFLLNPFIYGGQQYSSVFEKHYLEPLCSY